MIFLLIMLFMANPSWKGESEYAKAYDGALKNQDYDEAIRLCSKAIESGKLSGADLSEAFKRRGKAWNKKEEYDLAIQDYDKSLEIDPNDAGTYFTRGNAWFDKGDYDCSLADFNKAITLTQNNSQVNLIQGRGSIW